MLEFGNRGGSWFALIFFAAIFGLAGWAISRQIKQRSGGRFASLGRTLGAMCVIGPVSLVYWSMLSGFYELEIEGRSIRLHYLLPAMVVETPLEHSSARVAPAYRDRARLVLSTDYGVYESTPSRRSGVNEALKVFNARVGSVGQ